MYMDLHVFFSLTEKLEYMIRMIMMLHAKGTKSNLTSRLLLHDQLVEHNYKLSVLFCR